MLPVVDCCLVSALLWLHISLKPFICCDRLVRVALHPINTFQRSGELTPAGPRCSPGIHYLVKHREVTWLPPTCDSLRRMPLGEDSWCRRPLIAAPRRRVWKLRARFLTCIYLRQQLQQRLRFNEIIRTIRSVVGADKTIDGVQQLSFRPCNWAVVYPNVMLWPVTAAVLNSCRSRSSIQFRLHIQLYRQVWPFLFFFFFAFYLSEVGFLFCMIQGQTNYNEDILCFLFFFCWEISICSPFFSCRSFFSNHDVG